MDLIEGLIGMSVVAAVAGLPVYLGVVVASAAVVVLFGLADQMSAFLGGALVSLLAALIFTLVIWRLWPVALGGPMWGLWFGPAVLAAPFSLAAVSWFAWHRGKAQQRVPADGPASRARG